MKNAKAITDGETALATIDIAVPPERAFEALNSAEVEHWWGAPGLYRFSDWQSELRVGGRWQVNVCLPDGAVLPASGEYLVLDAPHRVTLTRRYEWDHPTLGRHVTRVTYRFDPIECGTRVAVRQDDFGSREAACEHVAGWERTLNLLHGYLSRAVATRRHSEECLPDFPRTKPMGSCDCGRASGSRGRNSLLSGSESRFSEADITSGSFGHRSGRLLSTCPCTLHLESIRAPRKVGRGFTGLSS